MTMARHPAHGTTAETVVDVRYEGLKRMLIARQRDLMSAVNGTIRRVRADGLQKEHVVPVPGETGDVDGQDDLELALVQMKAETLNKINEALLRLEEGRYGYCFECGTEIAGPRLLALPFAVRCKDCEEGIEMAEQRDRARTRHASSALGFEFRR